jgi:ferredoxin-NADP reductase
VGTIHAWQSGRDLAEPLLKAVLLVLLAVGVLSYLSHKLLVPALLRRKAFRVADLRKESARVWTLSFHPPAGVPPLRHLPGQFQFLTLRKQEHPFTISSWVPDAGPHSSSIKESGDYTATIGGTSAGERVLVQGPFGRFSYLLYPEERDFVFLAGGIGITPFISMLRHMEQTRQNVPVLLLYANRSESDIVFRDELERIARGGRPRLRVVHVLEHPPAGWQGETGRIDRGLVERHLAGGVAGKAFYLCGPPPMMRALLRTVRRLGVARRRLHWERFAL